MIYITYCCADSESLLCRHRYGIKAFDIENGVGFPGKAGKLAITGKPPRAEVKWVALMLDDFCVLSMFCPFIFKMLFVFGLLIDCIYRVEGLFECG